MYIYDLHNVHIIWLHINKQLALPYKSKAMITFNEVPETLSKLCIEVALLRDFLKEANHSKLEAGPKWFNIDQLSEYLPDKPARATIYCWVNKKKIPVHKGSKKLRFLKSDIDEWLKSGKKTTPADFQRETDTFLTSKRKGGKR